LEISAVLLLFWGNYGKLFNRLLLIRASSLKNYCVEWVDEELIFGN
jgi:hypothetical protein